MSSDINPLDKLNIDDIVECFKNAVNQALTKGKEENLRFLVSNCIINKIIEPLKREGINIPFELEYTLPSGKRIDLLCGNVIIEFKDPYKFSSESAEEQVRNYILEKAEHDKKDLDDFLGVIISDKIAFVRYNKTENKWRLEGPFEINKESIKELIEALRGLRKKSLSAEELAKDFGIKSQISKKIVRLLYTKLLNTTEKEKTWALFNDWKRLFGQIIGYSDEKDLEKFKELKELKEYYEIKEDNINYSYLIFAIHTYYALIMKLLAAEIASIHANGELYRSYIGDLREAYKSKLTEGLKDELQKVESGYIFKELLGIENFLEGDYFSWYIEKIDNKLAEAIIDLVKELSNYDMTTIKSNPESTRDLLKDLYQDLIPRDIRHRFGEYYTPDWLAELLLDEIGLSYENLENMGKEDDLKPLKIRVLDPACGSGTFLILYISRLKRYAEKYYLKDKLAKYVLENVVGYDLNPLAVLAARTNYLLAIGDLISANRNELGSIEIPIYLADSIIIQEEHLYDGKYFKLKIRIGEKKFVDLRIPDDIARNTKLLKDLLNEMRKGLKYKWTDEDFEKRISFFNLPPEEKEILLKERKKLAKLYQELFKLEKEGKDGIWIYIIKNAFAPLLKGKFDYIIGNPPWINWESLPEQYRESSKELWKKYGLLEIKGKTGLGKVKRDLSMLFLARCFDLYLKVGGKLGFVITFTVFKNQAGAGFRNFLARRTKIHVIHDLVTLAPFEGATNRTGIIIVEKVCELDNMNDNECEIIRKVQKENMNSIKHVIWNGKKIDPNKSLKDIIEMTKHHEIKHYEITMVPLIPNDPSSPWMQVKPNIVNAIRKVISGNQYYEAHAGVYVGLDQIYYVKVYGKSYDNMLIITNPPESGQKKKVKQIKDKKVEPDLIYPLIRGRDVKKWYVEFKDRYIIVPHDPKTAKPISERDMKDRWHLTYDYLSNYKNELENRSIHKLWGKGNPFYSIYDIGTYTFAPYKVVWKNITGAITGKAASFACAVVEPINGKPTIPNVKLMLVETKTSDEAYYIAGILNSVIARSIIASYTYETVISTNIIDIIKIPKFDPNNNLHKKIAKLSERAHELAKCIYSNNKPDYCKNINAKEELKKVEDEIDLSAAELYGISKEELEGFKELMDILSGK
ncbi:MAG: N-6 DNA methylase [Candidatus Nanopusillus sp.]